MLTLHWGLVDVYLHQIGTWMHGSINACVCPAMFHILLCTMHDVPRCMQGRRYWGEGGSQCYMTCTCVTMNYLVSTHWPQLKQCCSTYIYSSLDSLRSSFIFTYNHFDHFDHSISAPPPPPLSTSSCLCLWYICYMYNTFLLFPLSILSCLFGLSYCKK